MYVDGIAQGLAHPHIVKGGNGVVQIQRLNQLHGVFHHGKPALHLAGLGVGHMDGHIQGPALQAHHQGVAVGDDTEGHLIQIGRLTPVALILLDNHAVLGRIRHKPEGPGADRILGDAIAGTLRDDGGGHGVNKLQTGFGQSDGHMAVIRGGNVGNIRKRRDQRRSIVLRSGAAFQGIDHIFHGDRLPIVERDAFPQGEGVRQSIL